MTDEKYCICFLAEAGSGCEGYGPKRPWATVVMAYRRYNTVLDLSYDRTEQQPKEAIDL